jgi:hypothetical protein
LKDRLQTGRFTEVNQMTAAQINQYLKREELEQRRETALKTLEQLDRELAEAGPPAESRPN